MSYRWIAAALAAGFLWLQPQTGGAADQRLPHPDHVVMVIFENHSFDQIIDSGRAPYILSLAANGALFVNAFAVSHPSQPNYFALFSGSTQGVRDNAVHSFDVPNLATALDAASKSFVGFVETGSPREHNPWESFSNARKVERNLSKLPNDFTQLPTVAFIIPNLNHDMHGGGWRAWLQNHLHHIIPGLDHAIDDGWVRDGDTWLKDYLGSYAEWAKAHNSLLIVTFDEDDDHANNHIPTIIFGAHVRPDRYAERITHYNVFSTLLGMYALAPFAGAVINSPIYSIWESMTPRQSD
jgi:phosphatidylinositol-3-phosphatase